MLIKSGAKRCAVHAEAAKKVFSSYKWYEHT